MKTTLKKTLILYLFAKTTIVFSQIDFMPYQTISTGARTENIVIGDLNNDLLNDIAITTRAWLETDKSKYKLMIYYQEHTGDLSEPIIYYYPDTDKDGASSIDIGDLNNDSLNDIVIGFSDSIMIFYQDKSSYGNFDSIMKLYSGNGVDAIKIKDINNDTLDDIVVTHGGQNHLRIFYQSNSDTLYFKDYIAPESQNTDLEIADINNDSLSDILMVSMGKYHGFHIIRQNTKEVFDSAVYYNLAEDFAGIAVDDINNDNMKDIVLTNFINDAFLYIFINNGNDDFYSNPVLINAYDGPVPVEIADLNCDGNKEIISAHRGWRALTVYDKMALGYYDDYTIFPNVYGKYSSGNNSLDIGDLNGDLSPDIAIAPGENYWVLFVNNSKPYVTDTFQIEKILMIDTLFNTFTYVDTITIESYDTLKTIRIDSTVILKSYIYKTSRLYDYYRREGDLCDGYYMDSILADSSNNFEPKTLVDTVYTSSSYDTIILSPNSINNILKDYFVLYPNPSTGEINIKYNYISHSQKCSYIEIQVYNTLGELQFSKYYLSSINRPIKIKDKGTFFLKINSCYGISIHKIIIL